MSILKKLVSSKNSRKIAILAVAISFSSFVPAKAGGLFDLFNMKKCMQTIDPNFETKKDSDKKTENKENSSDTNVAFDISSISAGIFSQFTGIFGDVQKNIIEGVINSFNDTVNKNIKAILDLVKNVLKQDEFKAFETLMKNTLERILVEYLPTYIPKLTTAFIGGNTAEITSIALELVGKVVSSIIFHQ